MSLTWTTGPDADTATLVLGGLKGEVTIRLRTRVTDREWRVGQVGIDETGALIPHAHGPCTSRLDGRRAALDAIERTLQTALIQVRDWRGAL